MLCFVVSYVFCLGRLDRVRARALAFCAGVGWTARSRYNHALPPDRAWTAVIWWAARPPRYLKPHVCGRVIGVAPPPRCDVLRGIGSKQAGSCKTRCQIGRPHSSAARCLGGNAKRAFRKTMEGRPRSSAARRLEGNANTCAPRIGKALIGGPRSSAARCPWEGEHLRLLHSTPFYKNS